MIPFKKIICVFFVIALPLSLFACGNSDRVEYTLGEINNLEIKNNAQNLPKENWAYFDYANLKFKLNENQHISYKNARILRIDDQNKGFAMIAAPLYGGEETPLASKLESIFEEDLSAIECLYEGSLLHEQYIGSPVEILSNTLSNNLNYSINVFPNVYLENGEGQTINENIYAIHANIVWNNLAISLRTFCDKESLEGQKEATKALLETFDTIAVSTPSLNTYNLGGISFTLPDDFEITSSQGVEYLLASTDSSSKYSGIGISVTSLVIDKTDRLLIAKEVVPAIARTFLPSGKYSVIGSIPEESQSITIFSKSADFLLDNISYIAKDYEGGSFYGKEGTGILFIYLLPSGKQITLFSPASQIDAASEIDSYIQSFSNLL